MGMIQTIKVISTIIDIAKPVIETVSPKLQEGMKDFAEC